MNKFVNVRKEGVRFVINAFGATLRLKYKQQIDYPINSELICNLKKNIQPNTVLMLEANDFHGEIMSGYIKYLLDLGYKVDVLTTEKHAQDSTLCRMPMENINFYATNISTIEKILQDKTIMNQYCGLFVNSYFLFRKDRAIKSPAPIYKYFHNIALPENGFCVNVCHTLDKLRGKFFRTNKCISLAKNKRDLPIVNPCYFGNVKITNKNPQTIFLISGDGSKNFAFIVDAVKKLLAEGITNFCFYITGRYNHNELEKSLAHYIKFLGYVSFEKLYETVEESDFIIPCLDPENKKHQWYLENGTTGAFQLSYGFLKPMILARKFSNKALVDNESAILYESNSDFYKSLKQAIELHQTDYSKMQENLAKIRDILYKTSLCNLKTLLPPSKNRINPSFVLMNKTCKEHIERLKILKNSLDLYNHDKIPFYIVCPKTDIDKIKQSIINGNEKYKITILEEEKFSSNDLGAGWLNQQVIKMKFYKAQVAEFFLVLDSDSYFIRNFYYSDFMYDERTPYIVCHEGKDAKLINNSFGNSDMTHKEETIKNFFNRKGKHYRFLTSPFIFSSQVLKELDCKYNIEKLISLVSCEAAWHGEYLLTNNTVPFKICEPLFKAFVYEKMYRLYHDKLKLSLKDIRKYYIGIVMQDRHCKEKLYEH